MSYTANTLRHKILNLIAEPFGLDVKSILSRTPPYLPSETTFQEVLGIDENGHTILKKAGASDGIVIKRQTLYEKSTGELVYFNSAGIEIAISTDLGDTKYSTSHATLPTGLGQVCMDSGIFYFSASDGNGGYEWIALPVLAHTHTLTTIAVEGTPVNAVASSKVLTVAAVPEDDETVTIGGVVYKAKTALTEPAVANEILKEDTAEKFIDNLVLAITGGAGVGVKYGTGTVTHTTVTAAKASASTMTATAKTKGVAGDLIALTETLSNGASVWAGGATFLGGGVNGTVGTKGDMKYDTSYIYTAIANNTIADANWRRIALGSAF